MRLLRDACGVLVAMLVCATAWGASTLDYPGLGTVTIERPPGAPRHVVIFLSGDGGWNKGVVDMARHLVDEEALVAGVDVTQMERQARDSRAACVASAGMLEGLSHFVQQRFGLQHYEKPVLVGYSSGATLAYATLAQAPPGTFKGAVSLGFCPDLEWSRPLCRGRASSTMRPGSDSSTGQPDTCRNRGSPCRASRTRSAPPHRRAISSHVCPEPRC